MPLPKPAPRYELLRASQERMLVLTRSNEIGQQEEAACTIAAALADIAITLHEINAALPHIAPRR